MKAHSAAPLSTIARDPARASLLPSPLMRSLYPLPSLPSIRPLPSPVAFALLLLAATACSSSKPQPAAPTAAPPAAAKADASAAPLPGPSADPQVTACESGDPMACLSIVRRIEAAGTAGAAERTAMIARFTPMCDVKPAHCFALAWVTKDPVESVLLHQRACDVGVAPACYMYGLHVNSIADTVTGEEQADMLNAALVTFGMACQGGFHDGCVERARMQFAGRGGPRDLPGARATLKIACDRPGGEKACDVIRMIECQEGLRTKDCPAPPKP